MGFYLFNFSFWWERSKRGGWGEREFNETYFFELFLLITKIKAIKLEISTFEFKHLSIYDLVCWIMKGKTRTMNKTIEKRRTCFSHIYYETLRSYHVYYTYFMVFRIRIWTFFSCKTTNRGKGVNKNKKLKQKEEKGERNHE